MKLLLATAAGSLILSACDARDDDASNAMGQPAIEESNLVTNTATATALAPQDFVTAVAGSDLYEIESGRLAQEKATAADLKAFGQMLVTDHTRSSEQLKAAASRAEPAVTVPTALPADMQAKIDALQAASGAEFERLFVEQQTEGHRMALDTLRSYAAGGDQHFLREFAAAAQPVVEGHLNQLTSRQ